MIPYDVPDQSGRVALATSPLLTSTVAAGTTLPAATWIAVTGRSRRGRSPDAVPGPDRHGPGLSPSRSDLARQAKQVM